MKSIIKDFLVTWLVFSIVMGIGALIGIYYFDKNNLDHSLNKELDIQKERLDTFQMYYHSEYGREFNSSKYKYGVDGLAFGDTHFCVWVKNRTFAEVLETVSHEYQHTQGMTHD